MVEYVNVTELPGCNAHKEQIERLFQRYHLALEYCKDKDVLEVACGGGIGLGYIAKYARKVVGGDIDEKVLEFARRQYENRHNIELKVLDAQQLPFDDKSFDVVILYESIYYLPSPDRFIKEAHRILRGNGNLLICTVNKDWSDFNPSPHSQKYFSVPELFTLLSENGFEVKIFGGFPAYSDSFKDKLVSIIKRIAVKLHLMPKTMKGKEKLKRMFFGRLKQLPPEIYNGIADYIPPTPIAHHILNKDFKVVYTVAYVK